MPEVETIRFGLNKFLPGKIIKSIDFDWPKSFPNTKADVDKFLIGAKIIRVARRAKVLLIELGSKYSLVIHLKMTGQLVFVGPADKKVKDKGLKIKEEDKPRKSLIVNRDSSVRFGAGHPTGSLIGQLPDKSTRVTLTFKDGSRLFFNDQRKFGWMRLISTAEVMNLDFFKKVGPEPLAADFTWQDFQKRLARRPNSNIKSVLLDQTVVAGVGNIYADESLWGAKIHPQTLVKDLSVQRTHTLFEELIYVLKLSIDKGGSTDKNYVNAEGKRGGYLCFARVFRREGQPCPRHPDTAIIKIRVTGRGTHICHKCQKEPK